MSLDKVEITSDVFWTCMTHALTTEAEEIMGLLLGDVKEGPNGEQVARVWFAMPQIRTDRRKDRVEASPEQMVRCAAQAEECSKQRGVRIRVIGWYHSHPHITVLPSHVDVRTQATYQQLDEGFIGLIFSTFNEDATTLAQRVQVTAFQSVPARAKQSVEHMKEDYDSAMAAALQASRQEADTGNSGGWTRKEVPLEVVQSDQGFERSDNLFGLMRVLFREEQSSFRRAITNSSDTAGNIHPLAAIHFGATYQQHMCQLIELVLGPTVQALENYKTQVHLQMQRLRSQEAELTHKLKEAQQQLAIVEGEKSSRVRVGTMIAEGLEASMPPDFVLQQQITSAIRPPGMMLAPSSGSARLSTPPGAATVTGMGPRVGNPQQPPSPGMAGPQDDKVRNYMAKLRDFKAGRPTTADSSGTSAADTDTGSVFVPAPGAQGQGPHNPFATPGAPFPVSLQDQQQQQPAQAGLSPQRMLSQPPQTVPGSPGMGYMRAPSMPPLNNVNMAGALEGVPQTTAATGATPGDERRVMRTRTVDSSLQDYRDDGVASVVDSWDGESEGEKKESRRSKFFGRMNILGGKSSKDKSKRAAYEDSEVASTAYTGALDDVRDEDYAAGLPQEDFATAAAKKGKDKGKKPSLAAKVFG